MSSRIALFGLALFAGLTVGVGCGDPPGIVPVAPPGTEFPKTVPPTAGSGAEALGESAALQGAAPVAVSTVVSEPTAPGETKKTPSGVVYETLKPGTGAVVQPGQTVKVNYIGRLTDGKVFDQSKTPIEFRIGYREVIKGWDEGVPGMKVGERRRLLIPADLGYGAAGSPPVIPPNSNLNFEVEVVDAK